MSVDRHDSFYRNCLKHALGGTLSWQKFVVHKVVGFETSIAMCLVGGADWVRRPHFESEFAASSFAHIQSSAT